MDEDSWGALGLAPGGDAGAVRSAYAARLKAIDVDADPGAFMRLRAAYDAVLCEVADGDDDGVAVRQAAAPPDDSPEPQPVPRAPRREDTVPYGTFERERAAFDALLERGATRPAAATLEKLLARGIVPLGAEDALVRALTSCVLGDLSLRPEELAALAKTFGSAELAEYAEASRWRARITVDANLGDGPTGSLRRFFRRRTRVARALFADKPENLFSPDLPHLRREVEALHRYARWFDGFLDPLEAERKLVRLERWLRVEEIVAVLAFLLVAALWSAGQFVK